MGNKWVSNAFIYLIIFVAVIAIFFTLFSSGGNTEKVDLSAILQMAENEQISRVVVDGDTLIVTPKNSPNELLTAAKEPGTSVYELFLVAGVDPNEKSFQIEVQQSSGFGTLFGVFLQFLPLIFFGAILLFMMRQAQGSNNQTMGFGRSKARIFSGNRPTVTFADVAGVEE